MPQVEAAGCGVPVMSIDYSAMADVSRKTKGHPLKVKKLFYEMESTAQRAQPDNEYLARKLDWFFKQSEAERIGASEKVFKTTHSVYAWDKTAKQWEVALDKTPPVNLQGKWDTPYRDFTIREPEPPEDSPNLEFVKWIYNHVVFKPDEAYSLAASKLLCDLNRRFIVQNLATMPFSRKEAKSHFMHTNESMIKCEKIRCGFMEMETPDYILEANK
jgi:hypothetical protein